MESNKHRGKYGRSRVEMAWDSIRRFQLLQELACGILGHIRVEHESFSTYQSTDISTGEIIDRGHSKGKTYVFCERCGKDMD